MGKTRSHRTARRGRGHQQSQPKGKPVWPRPERGPGLDVWVAGLGSRSLGSVVCGGSGSIRPGPSPAPRTSHGGSHRQVRCKAEQEATASLTRPEIARGGGCPRAAEGHGSPVRLRLRPIPAGPTRDGLTARPRRPSVPLGHRCFSSSPPTFRPAGRHRHAQCGTRGRAVLGPLPGSGVGGRVYGLAQSLAGKVTPCGRRVRDMGLSSGGDRPAVGRARDGQTRGERARRSLGD